MDFKGVIKKVLPAKSGVPKKGNSWVSQDFVIEEVGNRYNQSIVFNVFGQDNIDQFQLAEGLMVTVQLDFKVNEWNEKFYNGVTCYNVTHEGAVRGSLRVALRKKDSRNRSSLYQRSRGSQTMMTCLLIKPLV